MTKAHDIVWLPQALCDRLAAELQQQLDDWTKSWGLPKVGDVVSCLSAAGAPPLSPDVIDLMAPAPAGWRNALAQSLLKARADSPIVEGVLRRVIGSLQERLQASFAATLALSNEPARPGHQGMAFSVTLLGLRCGLFLTNDALRSSGRLRRPQVPPLPSVHLEQAMASLPVSLVAQLGRASLGVTELLQLMPGDVLVLKECLASPLRLVSPGSSLSLTAHLGATPDSTRRAVRCAATH